MRQLSALDVFCGAGGLSCGLEQAGLHVLGGVEFDRTAHATYLANHPAARALPEPVDATALDGPGVLRACGLAVGELDVIAGGPPCQGFSMAGYREAGDHRNTLVFQFARLVRELQPRFFVMENVVGLLSMRTATGRRVLDALVEELDHAGYRTNLPDDPARWSSLVVNAADHGVPQRRRRMLLFGARDAADPVPALRPPSHHDGDCLPLGAARPHVTVAEALLDLPEPERDEPMRLPRVDGLSAYAALMRSPDGLLWNHAPTKHRPFMVERMRAQRQGDPLYDTWAHAWVRLREDEPSPTVKENHNAPSVHPRMPRVLTPRECARLQSFPDAFRFTGTKSRQLVQVGNAVPPLLGRAIGQAFVDAAAGTVGEGSIAAASS